MQLDNKEIVPEFYEAFARRDFEGILQIYAKSVHYHDPIFDIRGDQVSGLWDMMRTEETGLNVKALSIGESGFFKIKNRKSSNILILTVCIRVLARVWVFWGKVLRWANWLQIRFKSQVLKPVNVYRLSYLQVKMD